ncbi:MAG TPA: hypothetical protein VJ441_00845, partial [Dehalococcoidia bacterium]|nr:hypothetical protein [Dehalococcoidia bacterium]
TRPSDRGKAKINHISYLDHRVFGHLLNRWNTAKAGKKRLKNCKGPDCPKLIEFKERAFSM